MHAFASGMTPNAFWTATPAEVSLTCRGYGVRLNRWQELAAWHLAPLLNAWCSEHVTPSRLLGRDEGALQQRHGRLAHPDPRGAMAALTRSFLEAEED